MRTTIHIQKDVYRAVKEVATQEGFTKSKAINYLVCHGVDSYNELVGKIKKSGKQQIAIPKIKGF